MGNEEYGLDDLQNIHRIKNNKTNPGSQERFNILFVEGGKRNDGEV